MPVSPTAPRPTIASAATAILAAEGPYHVAGRYIADASLATRARQLEAERRVRDAERAALTAHAPRCPWCAQLLGADEPRVAIGLGELHAVCADAFDVFAYGEQSADTFAPLDESDVLAIEAENGTALAWADGYLAGQSVGEQRGAFAQAVAA